MAHDQQLEKGQLFTYPSGVVGRHRGYVWLSVSLEVSVGPSPYTPYIHIPCVCLYGSHTSKHPHMSKCPHTFVCPHMSIHLHMSKCSHTSIHPHIKPPYICTPHSSVCPHASVHPKSICPDTFIHPPYVYTPTYICINCMTVGLSYS